MDRHDEGWPTVGCRMGEGPGRDLPSPCRFAPPPRGVCDAPAHLCRWAHGFLQAGPPGCVARALGGGNLSLCSGLPTRAARVSACGCALGTCWVSSQIPDCPVLPLSPLGSDALQTWGGQRSVPRAWGLEKEPCSHRLIPLRTPSSLCLLSLAPTRGVPALALQPPATLPRALSPSHTFFFFKKAILFFLRFYLFIHERERETERERQRPRQREKQAPCREPDVRLDPGSPGSQPGLKAALNR